MLRCWVRSTGTIFGGFHRDTSRHFLPTLLWALICNCDVVAAMSGSLGCVAGPVDDGVKVESGGDKPGTRPWIKMRMEPQLFQKL